MPFRKYSRGGDKSSVGVLRAEETTSFVASPEVALQQSRASWEARENSKEDLRSWRSSSAAEFHNATPPPAIASERPQRGLGVGRPHVNFPEHKLEGAFIENGTGRKAVYAGHIIGGSSCADTDPAGLLRTGVTGR